MGTGRFSGNSYTFSALDMTKASHEEFWFRCSCRTLNRRLTHYFLREHRRGQEPIAYRIHLLAERSSEEARFCCLSKLFFFQPNWDIRDFSGKANDSPAHVFPSRWADGRLWSNPAPP